MKININVESLRLGVYIGFKLGTLEFIWDSKYEIAQNVFSSTKEELLSHLPLTYININDSNYITFSQSILGYYFKTNRNIYNSILIGISIQRSWLVGSAKDDFSNKEMEKLAKSTLNSISQRIIPDKEYLYEFIIQNKGIGLFNIFDKLELMCDNKDNITLLNVQNRKPTLFLSYAQKDSPIADIIENQIKKETNGGIEISRYTRVQYKESFKSFMNSIQEHDFVLCIVSGNYLRSKACMYEVGEIVSDNNFNQKLLFIVLSENDKKFFSDKKEDFLAANIYGSPLNRIKYIKYWETQFKELEEELDNINSLEAKRNLSNDLYEIGKIYRNDISNFLDYLVQNNGKSFEELYNTDFVDIINWINHKFIS